MTLDGKRAIVTGASSGIGEATVGALCAQGVRVAGLGRDSARLTAVESRYPGQFTGIIADLSDPAQIEEAIDRAVERLGRINILVNSAGVGFRGNLVETTDEQYATMFDVNVRAVFLTCRQLIPRMVEWGGGAIINVASAQATKGAVDRAIYATTKAAVAAMTKSIAVDFGAKGIRANCVAPGVTETPWIKKILAGAENVDGLRAQMAARQAIGRVGTPEEIANVIAFLASDAASFMHGALVAVDGGQTAW